MTEDRRRRYLMIKNQLNKFKNNLSKYTDNQMRRGREKLSSDKFVGNRCYYKLKQIDEKFDICKNCNIFLDLAGGPGQFVNYMFNVNYNCRGYGVTLKQSQAGDYKFHHTNFHQLYGANDTGDLFDSAVNFEIELFCGGKCDLVLADGAIDVSGRENHQESLTLPLLTKECEIILQCLTPGGACVLKIFDTFEETTIRLLNNFVNYFDSHYVYKPAASKAANSEKYLICLCKLHDKRRELITAKLDTIKFAKLQLSALRKLLKILETNYGKRH